jgi:hypothetical protein
MKITSPTVDRSYLTAARSQLQKPLLFKSRLLRVSGATWRVPSQSSTSSGNETAALDRQRRGAVGPADAPTRYGSAKQPGAADLACLP